MEFDIDKFLEIHSMVHFDEDEHPRDDKGRFTEKGTIDVAEATLKTTASAANILAKGISARDDRPIGKKYSYPKYKNISNEELQKRINRLNLEKQYSDLKGDTKYVKSGNDMLRETMQTLATILTISATVIGAIAKFKSDSN